MIMELSIFLTFISPKITEKVFLVDDRITVNRPNPQLNPRQFSYNKGRMNLDR